MYTITTISNKKKWGARVAPHFHILLEILDFHFGDIPELRVRVLKFQPLFYEIEEDRVKGHDRKRAGCAVRNFFTVSPIIQSFRKDDGIDSIFKGDNAVYLSAIV